MSNKFVAKKGLILKPYDGIEQDAILKTNITGDVVTGATFNDLSNTAHTHTENELDLSSYYTQDEVNSNFLSANTNLSDFSGVTLSDYYIYTGVTAPNTYLPYTISDNTNFTTGILDRDNTTMSFNSATTEFTIEAISGNYTIYYYGRPYTYTNDSIVLSAQTGFEDNQLWFIYYYSTTPDETPSFIATSDAWSIANSAPIALVYWNGSKGNLGDERHNAVRNLSWHEWAHTTQGTQYTSGLDAQFYTTGLTISSGILEDEDILLNIPESTKLEVWHIAPDNEKITFENELSNISAWVSGGSLLWDNNGVPTNVQDGYYIKNFIYGTNSLESEAPCAIIAGQAEYSNINDARNGIFPEFPTYISPETRLIYITIWKNDGGVPTYIESADFRTALTAPNGVLGKRPIYFDEIEDVQATTPNIDDTLRFNGEIWITGPAATISVNAGGSSFYLSTPEILISDTENNYNVSSLERVFTTNTTQTVTASVTNNTDVISAFLYTSGLGYTTIPSGTYTYQLYAGVDSTSSGRVTSIEIATYKVDQIITDTVVITGTGTQRNANATGAFVDVIGSTTLINSSYLQTPKGLYQIISVIDDDNVTIETPIGYVNETNITGHTWIKLFNQNTGTITNLTPNYGLYTINSTQAEFTILETTKLGTIFYVVGTDNNTTETTIAYDSSDYTSYFIIPQEVLHNELTGLNGGSSDFYYHLTQTEKNNLDILDGGVSSNASTLHNHDGRYYTETEIDNNFLNLSGDTLSGELNIEYSTTESSDLSTGSYLNLTNLDLTPEANVGIRFRNGTTPDTYKAGIIFQDDDGFGAGDLHIINSSDNSNGNNITSGDTRILMYWEGNNAIYGDTKIWNSLNVENNITATTYYGNIDSSNVLFDSTAQLFADNVESAIDELDNYRTKEPGITNLISYEHNDDGSINISATTAMLYNNPMFLYSPKEYTIPFKKVSLEPNKQSYIYAEYNGGTPQYGSTTAVSYLSGADIVPVFAAYNFNDTITHELSYGVAYGKALVTRISSRILYTEPIKYQSGLELGQRDNNIIEISGGTVWFGVNQTPLDYVETNEITGVTSTNKLWYHSAGTWTFSCTERYDSTLYDNGTDLENLGSSSYGVIWIYRSCDLSTTSGVINYLYGDKKYSSLTEAKNSTLPSDIPSYLNNMAILVGRIEFAYSSTTAANITSALKTKLIPDTIVKHNDLVDIQGGNSATTTYYHMDNFEYDTIVGGGEASQYHTHDDRYIKYYNFTGTTGDENVYTLPLIDIESGQTLRYNFNITAHSTNNTYGVWERDVVLYDSGTTELTFINSTFDYQNGGLTPNNIDFSMSGSTLNIIVTGVTSKIINWDVKFTDFK